MDGNHHLILGKNYFLLQTERGHFRYIKIHLDSEAWRTQTKEMDKHDYSISLFLSSAPYRQAKF